MSTTDMDRLRRLRQPGAEPQELTDVLTIERVDAPDLVSPGDNVTVSATVSCAAPLFTACESAVRFSALGQEKRVPASGSTDIGEGTQQTFSASFQAPDSSFSVTIEAIEFGDVSGAPNVEDSAEAPIQVSSPAEVTIQNWAPWVVGGGGVGLGAAQLTGRDPLAGGAVGIGAGVGTKLALNQLGGFQIPVPEFPTTAVLATAALLGAGALLLWRLDAQLPDELLSFA